MTAFGAVAAGAVLGGWLRWGLSTWLNPRIPSLPLGTLMSNVVGGYLVGVAVAFFASHAALSPEWRLLVITGFLGGLTTFSTFSAEAVELLLSGRYGAAVAHIAAHLFGSLLATVIGIATYRSLAA